MKLAYRFDRDVWLQAPESGGATSFWAVQIGTDLGPFAHVVDNQSWGSVGRIDVRGAATSLRIDGILEANVALEGGAAQLEIVGARTGTISTGVGADSVVIGMATTGDDRGNGFRVTTGGGDDAVSLRAFDSLPAFAALIEQPFGVLSGVLSVTEAALAQAAGKLDTMWELLVRLADTTISDDFRLMFMSRLTTLVDQTNAALAMATYEGRSLLVTEDHGGDIGVRPYFGLGPILIPATQASALTFDVTVDLETGGFALANGQPITAAQALAMLGYGPEADLPTIVDQDGALVPIKTFSDVRNAVGVALYDYRYAAGEVSRQLEWLRAQQDPDPTYAYVALDGSGRYQSSDVRLGRGDDRFDGHGGRDTVRGGAGDDTLDGGGGDDELRGGTGADTFVFAMRAGVSSGDDVVVDFHDWEGDRLMFLAEAGFAASDLAITPYADGLLVDFGTGSVLLRQCFGLNPDAIVVVIA